MTFNKKTLLTVLLTLTFTTATPITRLSQLTLINDEIVNEEEETFDWNPVMEAIIQVESEGDAKAKSGKYIGAMQIAPILVQECNNILKQRNIKKRYSLRDRYSKKKSKEMFLLIQSHHNPNNDIEKAIRSWNGGMRYSVRATNRYYKKVMAALPQSES